MRGMTFCSFRLVSGVAALALSMAACAGTPPASPEASQTPPLATPVSQEPAAGICADFEGPQVEVMIYPDIPDPRCARIRAEQHLIVTNQTGGAIEIRLGSFAETLEPGGEVTLDTPFGEYLAPGVHRLEVSPCCGMELWLDGGSPQG